LFWYCFSWFWFRFFWLFWLRLLFWFWLRLLFWFWLFSTNTHLTSAALVWPRKNRICIWKNFQKKIPYFVSLW